MQVLAFYHSPGLKCIHTAQEAIKRWQTKLQAQMESTNIPHCKREKIQRTRKIDLTLCKSILLLVIWEAREGSLCTERASINKRTITCHCLNLKDGSASTNDMVSSKRPWEEKEKYKGTHCFKQFQSLATILNVDEIYQEMEQIKLQNKQTTIQNNDREGD